MKTNRTWKLPKPVEVDGEYEWQPVVRVGRHIPFGYRQDPDDCDILLPIPEELELFEKAKKPVIFLSHNVPFNTPIDQIVNKESPRNGDHFGSLIAMQLLMRRPEINRFIAISPQPNVYDFSFLSPCPTSGLMIYGKKDELVPEDYIIELNKRLSSQKGIKVEFQSVSDANHFFSKSENTLVKNLDKYIKKETALY